MPPFGYWMERDIPHLPKRGKQVVLRSGRGVIFFFNFSRKTRAEESNKEIQFGQTRGGGWLKNRWLKNRW